MIKSVNQIKTCNSILYIIIMFQVGENDSSVNPKLRKLKLDDCSVEMLSLDCLQNSFPSLTEIELIVLKTVSEDTLRRIKHSRLQSVRITHWKMVDNHYDYSDVLDSVMVEDEGDTSTVGLSFAETLVVSFPHLVFLEISKVVIGNTIVETMLRAARELCHLKTTRYVSLLLCKNFTIPFIQLVCHSRRNLPPLCMDVMSRKFLGNKQTNNSVDTLK